MHFEVVSRMAEGEAFKWGSAVPFIAIIYDELRRRKMCTQCRRGEVKHLKTLEKYSMETDEQVLKNAKSKMNGMLTKAGIYLGSPSASSASHGGDVAAKQAAAMEQLSRRATEATQAAGIAQDSMMNTAAQLSAAQNPSRPPPPPAWDAYTGLTGTARRDARTQVFYDKVYSGKKDGGKKGKGKKQHGPAPYQAYGKQANGKGGGGGGWQQPQKQHQPWNGKGWQQQSSWKGGW